MFPAKPLRPVFLHKHLEGLRNSPRERRARMCLGIIPVFHPLHVWRENRRDAVGGAIPEAEQEAHEHQQLPQAAGLRLTCCEPKFLPHPPSRRHYPFRRSRARARGVFSTTSRWMDPLGEKLAPKRSS